MRGHADRSGARSATAVGGAKGLVQVQVQDIDADPAHMGHTHDGIHVGPVHVDLPAFSMHNVADVAQLVFKQA